ncbi:hypothetical protein PHYSODRAFT_371548, partial [Phytophthora sojae]
LSLLTVVDAKMHLYFNDRFMGFGFSHSQRCYTISHCLDDHSKDSEWSGLSRLAKIAWYEDQYCAGASIARGGSKGSINFKGTKLYNKVSSFMVQLESLYPTDGMVDYCHEKSELNINTSTNATTLYFD